MGSRNHFDNELNSRLHDGIFPLSSKHHPHGNQHLQGNDSYNHVPGSTGHPYSIHFLLCNLHLPYRVHSSPAHDGICLLDSIHHDHGNQRLLSNAAYNHVLGSTVHPYNILPLQSSRHLLCKMHSNRVRDGICLRDNSRHDHDNQSLLSNAAYNHVLESTGHPYNTLLLQRNRHLLCTMHSNQVHDGISPQDSTHWVPGNRGLPSSVAYIPAQESKCYPCNTHYVRQHNPYPGYNFVAVPMLCQQARSVISDNGGLIQL